MVRLSRALLSEIETAAVAAWPKESCGLLLGRSDPDDGRITGVRPSRNLAADATSGFEIDPQLWLDARRELTQGGDQILGLYHSHPQGGPMPSTRDQSSAWPLDPTSRATIWLITALGKDRVPQSKAYLYHGPERGFEAVELHITD